MAWTSREMHMGNLWAQQISPFQSKEPTLGHHHSLRKATRASQRRLMSISKRLPKEFLRWQAWAALSTQQSQELCHLAFDTAAVAQKLPMMSLDLSTSRCLMARFHNNHFKLRLPSKVNPSSLRHPKLKKTRLIHALSKYKWTSQQPCWLNRSKWSFRMTSQNSPCFKSTWNLEELPARALEKKR